MHVQPTLVTVGNGGLKGEEPLGLIRVTNLRSTPNHPAGYGEHFPTFTIFPTETLFGVPTELPAREESVRAMTMGQHGKSATMDCQLLPLRASH